MAKVSVYLNFNRTTEEAFNFYREVFGTEFIGDIARMGDVPPNEDGPVVAEEDKNLVMHVALPLFGDFVLMGTDAPESMGFRIENGNAMYLNLEPDTREETERLFALLSEGGEVEAPLQEMFWGDYYGSCRDRFGVQWMFNCAN